MKCVRNPITSEIRRLPEHEAKHLVWTYGWVWVTKGEWKRSVRPDLSAMKQAARDTVAKAFTPMQRRV